MTKIMNFMKSKNKTPFWIHFWPLGNPRKVKSVKSTKIQWNPRKENEQILRKVCYRSTHRHMDKHMYGQAWIHGTFSALLISKGKMLHHIIKRSRDEVLLKAFTEKQHSLFNKTCLWNRKKYVCNYEIKKTVNTCSAVCWSIIF